MKQKTKKPFRTLHLKKREMIKQYIKKPIAIEAIEWTGENQEDVLAFCGNNTTYDDREGIVIDTLEGRMKSVVGDFIIKGVRGEVYPCKSEIFKETYEELPKLKDVSKDVSNSDTVKQNTNKKAKVVKKQEQLEENDL